MGEPHCGRVRLGALVSHVVSPDVVDGLGSFETTEQAGQPWHPTQPALAPPLLHPSLSDALGYPPVFADGNGDEATLFSWCLAGTEPLVSTSFLWCKTTLFLALRLQGAGFGGPFFFAPMGIFSALTSPDPILEYTS